MNIDIITQKIEKKQKPLNYYINKERFQLENLMKEEEDDNKK